MSSARHWFKRSFDVVAAIAALIVLMPALLCIGVLVRISLGRPVLFRQQRGGRNGQPFWIRKFRTMRSAAPGEDWARTDAERITPVGRLLRKTSCDELPELWNVVRGEMSLVGPRPLVLEYMERYTPRQARRHEVRPGITGWAQVNGRENIPFSRRLELDVWYVDHWSFWLDLKIILMTCIQIFDSSSIDAHTLEAVDDIGLSATPGAFVVRDVTDPAKDVKGQSGERASAQEPKS